MCGAMRGAGRWAWRAAGCWAWRAADRSAAPPDLSSRLSGRLPRNLPGNLPQGLTLIELMVALAIVALLMTLAVPSFGSVLARHRLKAAAEQLAADLAEARLLAAQRGHALHLNLHGGAPWCWAVTTTSGCDCRVVQSCQLKTVRASDHPGVTLLDGRELRIDAPGLGTLRAADGHALLQGREGAALRVALTPLGRAKVCAPGAAVAGYAGC